MAPHRVQEDEPSDLSLKDESVEVLVPSDKFKSSQFLQDPVNFNPSFYDTLGEVFLSTRALREVDRRSKLRGVSTWVIESPNLENLQRFGRQGGPDLSGLRGYSTRARKPIEPIALGAIGSEMEERPVPWTCVADENFAVHVARHHIYLPENDGAKNLPGAVPLNLEEILQRLEADRGQLFPTWGSLDAAFKHYRDIRNRSSVDLAFTKKDVIPFLLGSNDFLSIANRQFTELPSMFISPKIPVPQPTLCDGAHRSDLGKALMADGRILSSIFPYKDPDNTRPVAVNFFVEPESLKAGRTIPERKVGYFSAFAVRGIHSILSHGNQNMVYDGKAYVFSATFSPQNGIFRMFSHHATLAADGKVHYHICRLRTLFMEDDVVEFAQGIKVLRNLRDLACEKRDEVIREARERAESLM